MPKRIAFHDVNEVDEMVRSIIDDSRVDAPKIDVIQGYFTQIVRVTKRIDSPFMIHSHASNHVREILEGFDAAVGIDIPENYFESTGVYNVSGFIWQNGIHVPSKIMRQQIFLGGDVLPYDRSRTESVMYRSLGIALWNWMNYRIWGQSKEEKREYRIIRGERRYQDDSRDRAKHQQYLSYVAGEDFRYLFGTAQAGRGQWFLDQFEPSIPPPNPDVIHFWTREILRYGQRNGQTAK